MWRAPDRCNNPGCLPIQSTFWLELHSDVRNAGLGVGGVSLKAFFGIASEVRWAVRKPRVLGRRGWSETLLCLCGFVFLLTFVSDSRKFDKLSRGLQVCAGMLSDASGISFLQQLVNLKQTSTHAQHISRRGLEISVQNVPSS
jgi:hypothetical protein